MNSRDRNSLIEALEGFATSWRESAENSPNGRDMVEGTRAAAEALRLADGLRETDRLDRIERAVESLADTVRELAFATDHEDVIERADRLDRAEARRATRRPSLITPPRTRVTRDGIANTEETK